MPNLLHETLEILERNGKTEQDVFWVGDEDAKTTWEDFKSNADIDYDAWDEENQIYDGLLVVGDNWWLERVSENDIESWWEFKTMPVTPNDDAEINTVFGGFWDNEFWKE